MLLHEVIKLEAGKKRGGGGDGRRKGPVLLCRPIVRRSRSDACLCSETFCMMKMSSTTGGGVRQLFIPQYCVSHMAVFKQRPSTMTTEYHHFLNGFSVCTLHTSGRILSSQLCILKK